ncbi:MAG: site-specific tyrosine recombinase XerC [Acidobacteria bacterium ACB2]|nr:site-specific tyrosine recombinase XerC [Acidobacteria bacterium ACB2]
MPAKGQRKDWGFLAPNDPQGMPLLLEAWLEAMKVKAYAPHYVQNARTAVSAFIVWCQERGVTKAGRVTKPMIERYQRFLFHFRRQTKKGEGPLSLRTQIQRLHTLKLFFRWLAKNNYILANPASELELPRIPPRRPPEVFTVAEVEQVMAQPDLSTPYGVRDRAILETLYSTGMRRSELARLGVADIHSDAGIVRVRFGKGRKERIIPIGSRALAWIARYLVEVRPQLVMTPDDGTLFLTFTGKAFWPDTLTQMASDYVKAAGIKRPGSCHLFRHTMATLMLENGADIRFIQEMLGHATIQATEVYTHVAIKKLKEIHSATHPGANLEPMPAGDVAGEDLAEVSARELLSSLAAERGDEEGEDDPE